MAFRGKRGLVPNHSSWPPDEPESSDDDTSDSDEDQRPVMMSAPPPKFGGKGFHGKGAALQFQRTNPNLVSSSEESDSEEEEADDETGDFGGPVSAPRTVAPVQQIQRAPGTLPTLNLNQHLRQNVTVAASVPNARPIQPKPAAQSRSITQHVTTSSVPKASPMPRAMGKFPGKGAAIMRQFQPIDHVSDDDDDSDSDDNQNLQKVAVKPPVAKPPPPQKKQLPKPQVPSMSPKEKQKKAVQAVVDAKQKKEAALKFAKEQKEKEKADLALVKKRKREAEIEQKKIELEARKRKKIEEDAKKQKLRNERIIKANAQQIRKDQQPVVKPPSLAQKSPVVANPVQQKTPSVTIAARTEIKAAAKHEPEKEFTFGSEKTPSKTPPTPRNSAPESYTDEELNSVSHVMENILPTVAKIPKLHGWMKDNSKTHDDVIHKLVAYLLKIGQFINDMKSGVNSSSLERTKQVCWAYAAKTLPDAKDGIGLKTLYEQMREELKTNT